ncbi:sugar phosphate isomerase/epimerase [Phycicoccus ginsengisoli]
MRWPLAVSSLGMPEADLTTFLGLAVRHGCTGVELRAAPDQPVHVGLSPADRASVRTALADHGLTALDVSSYVRVCPPGDDSAVVADLRAHLRLAADIGALGVRVFPGGVGDGHDDERARGRLRSVLDEARDLGADVLVETHDSHPTGAAVARLLEPLPGAGVVWDVLHTWRSGEAPADTVAALGGLLRLVQVKDAAGPGPRDPLTLPGEGVLPVADVLAQLPRTGYAGWLSLEWEKSWHPGLPDLDAALAATGPWLEAAQAQDQWKDQA